MSAKKWTGIAAAFGFLLLILDAKTALSGASEGVELCLMTVVPSLFPFFFLSILLTGMLTGKKIKIFEPVSRLCRMPKGCESLLLIGLLGGYPAGAQAVSQSYQSGKVSKNDASRLLGFCSNAGPSFLFGMVATQFPSQKYAWMLWVIHIISAIIVGWLLPGKRDGEARLLPSQNMGIASTINQAVKTMASVCAWIILFRVVIAVSQRWFLWLLPNDARAVLIGILELSNGCLELHSIEDVSLRFIVCSGILSLGGLCVAMQTVSVTSDLGTGLYFPGKLLQTCISVVLSVIILLVSGFDCGRFLPLLLLSGLTIGTTLLILRKKKKKSSILQPISV